jgi:translation elongation factor EF-Ts
LISTIAASFPLSSTCTKQVLDTKAETVEALLETNLPDGKSVDQRVKEAISTIMNRCLF